MYFHQFRQKFGAHRKNSIIYLFFHIIYEISVVFLDCFSQSSRNNRKFFGGIFLGLPWGKTRSVRLINNLNGIITTFVGTGAGGYNSDGIQLIIELYWERMLSCIVLTSWLFTVHISSGIVVRIFRKTLTNEVSLDYRW